MEKEVKRVRKIVITGPESTGKTWLTKKLAKHFNTCYVPEYAREYVTGLNRTYNYEDISHIAEKQVELENIRLQSANKLLFYDTFLIITKIWFIWQYKKYPQWIDKHLENSDIQLFLLCNTDIPWIPDGVRENNGKNRLKLFEIYEEEIKKLQIPYKIISGEGEQRFNAAIDDINKIIKENE